MEARNNEEVYLEVDPLEEKDEEWGPTLAPPAVGPRHAPSDSRDSTVIFSEAFTSNDIWL